MSSNFTDWYTQNEPDCDLHTYIKDLTSAAWYTQEAKIVDLEKRLKLAEEYSAKLFHAAVRYANTNRVDDYQAMCDVIADAQMLSPRPSA